MHAPAPRARDVKVAGGRVLVTGKQVGAGGRNGDDDDGAGLSVLVRCGAACVPAGLHLRAGTCPRRRPPLAPLPGCRLLRGPRVVGRDAMPRHASSRIGCAGPTDVVRRACRVREIPLRLNHSMLLIIAAFSRHSMYVGVVYKCR